MAAVSVPEQMLAEIEESTNKWRAMVLRRMNQQLEFLWIPACLVLVLLFRETWAYLWLILCIVVVLVMRSPLSVKTRGIVIVIFSVFMWTLLALTNSGLQTIWMAPMYLAPVLAGAYHSPQAAAWILLLTTMSYGSLLVLHLTGFKFPPGPPALSGTLMWIMHVVASGITLPYVERHLVHPVIALQLETEKKQRALNELQQIVSAMKQALAHYSHAIRTPLNVLCNAAEILQSITPREDSHASMLHYAAQSLLALANTVLDILALELHALFIRQHTFNLHTVVRLICNSAASAALIKGLTFQSVIQPQVPVRAIGDSTRLQQILRNFMEVMFRRARGGLITLTVSCRAPPGACERNRQQAPDILVEFTVSLSDDISSAAPVISTTASGGMQSMINFNVTQKLLSAVGGWEEQGNEAAGCSVRLVIPLRRLEEEDEGRTLTDIPPLNILYADDTPTNQLVMQAMVRHTQHTLTCVDDGRQAVEEVCHSGHRYDLVILDYQMPEMTGVEAARAIRAWEATTSERRIPNRMPLVLLTAYAESEIRKEDLIEFNFGVVSKPLRRARLTELTEAVHWARVHAAETEVAAVALEETSTRMQPTTVASSVKQSVNTMTDAAAQESMLLSSIHDGLDTASPALSDDSEAEYGEVGTVRKLLRSHGVSFVDQWKLLGLTVTTAIHFALVLLFVWRPALLQPLLVDTSVAAGMVVFPALLLVLLSLVGRRAAVCAAAGGCLLFSVYVVGVAGWSPSRIHGCLLPLFMLLAGGSLVEILISAALMIVATLYTYSAVSFAAVRLPTDDLLLDLAWNLYCTLMSGLQAWYMLSRREHHLRQLVTLTHQVQLASESAHAQQEALERVLAAMSFDFRSPLNVILGLGQQYSSVLESSASDVKRQVMAMESAAHILRTLLDGLVYDKARTTGIPLSLQRSTFNLFDTVTDIARMSVFQARSTGRELCVRWANSTPTIVNSDSNAVQHILSCMIQEALSAPTTSTTLLQVVTIAVDSIPTLHASMVRHFPLPLEHQCLILEANELESHDFLSPRARLDPLSARRDSAIRFTVYAEGQHALAAIYPPSEEPWSTPVETGLTNNRIRVASFLAEQLGGILFRVDSPKPSLCCAVPVNVSLASSVSTAAASILWPRSLRIIIAEDAAEMQFLLGLYLRHTPHKFTFASSGRHTLELWKTHGADVILLDLVLPDQTGLDVARSIRASGERGADVAILCITAAAMPEDQTQALQAGVTLFETKPISRERLLQHLYRIAALLSPRASPEPTLDSERITFQLESRALRQQAASFALSTPVVGEPASDERWFVSVPAELSDFVIRTLLPQLRFQVMDLLAIPQQPPTALTQAARRWAQSVLPLVRQYGLSRVAAVAVKLQTASETAITALLDEVAVALESAVVITQ